MNYSLIRQQKKEVCHDRSDPVQPFDPVLVRALHRGLRFSECVDGNGERKKRRSTDLPQRDIHSSVRGLARTA